MFQSWLTKRRSAVVCIATLLASSNIAAQQNSADTLGTVVVRVTRDSATGSPLAGALVRAERTGSATDASGIVTLRLAPGQRTIVASLIGFRPESALVNVRRGVDTTIALPLTEHVAQVEGIVVSATRSERRVEDTPLRIEIVDEEEVAEKTSMRPGSIAMLLAETGGLRVQTTSPSLGGAAVRVQGLRGRYSLLLADGLPLYGGQPGGLGLLQIPPVDLARVEVIKGTASALYGSSALGGVINLVSRRPGEELERDIVVNQTSRDGTDVVAFASAPLTGQWGYTVLGGAHRQQEQDIDGDALIDIPGYRRVVVRPRVYFDDKAGRSAFLTAGFTGENRSGGTVEGANGAPFKDGMDTRRADVGGLGRVLFDEGALHGALLTVRGAAMEQRHAHQFDLVKEDDRHRTWFGEAALTIPRGAVTSVAGVAFQQDAYRAFDVPGFDYTYSIPSAFAQVDADVSSRLTVSAAGRVDAHSVYGTFFNPRLTVLVKGPAPEWTMRLSGGTGAFAPTPFTDETEVTGLTPLAPLTGLVAERARSASLDIGGPVTLPIGRMELNGTLFGSVIEHAVQVRDASGTTATGASRLALVNAPQPTRTWGTDLLARFVRDPFRITATYTYLRSTEWTPTTRREVPLNPRHAAGIVASIEHEGESRLGLELYYTGRQALENDPWRTTSKPYLLAGLLGEKRFGIARIFVNAEKLTNVRQTRDDPLLLPAPGRGGRRTTDVWAPLEGFVVNGGVRLGF